MNDRIKKIYLEITTRCNLDCTTCLRRLRNIKQHDISDETFERLVERIRETEAPDKMVFAGYGEPLMHPKALDYFARIKSLGLAVEVITNGTLLNEDVAERLVQLQVDAIYVSLDGIEESTYRAIRCGGDLTGVKNNISRLHRVRGDKQKPKIIGEMVMNVDNLGEVAAMIESREILGFDELMFSHLVPHTAAMNEKILYGGKGRIEPALERLLKRHAFRLAGDGKKRSGCEFVSGRTISVSVTGDIHPCLVLMHDYGFYRRNDFRTFPVISFGNIAEDQLDDIWTEYEYCRLREDMDRDVDANFPDCPGCYYDGACFDRANAKSDCYGHKTPCSDCLWQRKIALCP